MENINLTSLNYFIINGISDIPDLQVVVFVLILLLYLLIIGGNMTILLLVCLDHHLHTPMYYFLCNLSILDICCSTVTLHKPLATFITGSKTISYFACMTDIYFFSAFTSNELLILTTMSYDRYMAICNPLHYTQALSRGTCVSLSLGCLLMGFIELIPYMVLLVKISCYKSNVIDHFFCDISPVMELSCSDTYALQVLIFTEGVLLLSFTPFLLTLISYIFIIIPIMRIHTSSGRRKAFYTCSSHLIVVTLFYGTLFTQYLRPSSRDGSNKMFSLLNTVAVPILNPIIYSLQNKDVKSSMIRNNERFAIQIKRLLNTLTKSCIPSLMLFNQRFT